MKKFEKVEKKSKNPRIPLVLKLDVAGTPCRWISWQDVVIAKCTGKVRWELGDAIKLRGGTGRDGEQSYFMLHPIVAVEDQSSRKHRSSPPLTNRVLFLRDGHECAYCGNGYTSSKLSRDHIIPTSKGGQNTWLNCITACKSCNMRKSNRLLDEAGLKLRFKPFVPNGFEHLALQNRNILRSQYDYLEKGFSKYFRREVVNIVEPTVEEE